MLDNESQKENAGSSRDDHSKSPAGEMTVIEHLEELRYRIIISLLSWGVLSCIGWCLTPWIISYIKKYPPLANVQLILIRPPEAFLVRFKLAMIAGLILALPIIIQQATLFVLPALYAHERKWVNRLVPASVLLFYAGAAFSMFVIIPLTLQFFLVSMTQGIAVPQLSLEEYMNFLVSMTILVGLIFQMPIVLFFLTMIGVLSSTKLRSGRRHAIIIILIIAALATPSTDAFTMIVVAVPMILLYELCIWFSKLAGK